MNNRNEGFTRIPESIRLFDSRRYLLFIGKYLFSALPSWCKAEGAVFVNPGGDQSGMVWYGELNDDVFDLEREGLRQVVPRPGHTIS